MSRYRHLPKPGRGGYRTEFIPGVGHVVVSPEGRLASSPTPFRAQAEQLRDRLQIEADRKARRGPRTCMCCGATFDSEGIHNRLCGHCRGRSDGGSLSLPSASSGKVRRAARA